MNRRLGLLAPVAIVAMLAIAGCGSDKKESSTSTPSVAPTGTTETATPKPADKGGTTDLTISADASGALKFEPTKLSAKAGEVMITMDNPSDVPHAVSIRGDGVNAEGTGGTAGVGKGEKSTVSADLKPGKYTFYCPVDSHEQAGMKGTLVVK